MSMECRFLSTLVVAGHRPPCEQEGRRLLHVPCLFPLLPSRATKEMRRLLEARTCVRPLVWGVAVACPPLLVLGGVLVGQVFLLFWMENAGLSHTTSVWLFGAYGVGGSLFALAISPAVDARAKTRLAVGGTVVQALLVLALAAAASQVVAPGTAVHDSGVALAVVAACFVGQLGAAIVAGQALMPLMQLLIRAGAPLDSPAVDAATTRVLGVQYAMANAGALAAGLVYDALRQRQPTAATLAEANVLALGAAAAASLAGAALLVALAPRLEQAERHAAAWRSAPAPATLAAVSDVDDATTGASWKWQRGALWREPALWRFAGVCALLVATRAAMRHLDMTLPVVMQRTSGPKARFALLQGLNPALVLVLVPVVQWATSGLSGYAVITGGALVTALALVPVAFPFGGTGVATGGVLHEQPALAHYVAFVALFSLGEALWSPRFLPYALRLAPEGRQATYIALGSVPALLAKLPSSFLSAWLVEHYCPPQAACDATGLWRVVLALALLAPVGLALLHRVLNTEPAQSMRELLLTPPPPPPPPIVQ